MSDLALFAIQAELDLDDYASPEAFAAKHRRLAAQVAGRRRGEHALAVWPEVVGSFCGLAGWVDRVRDCTTTQQALTRLALRRFPALARGAFRQRARSREEALFVLVSPEVHRTMWTTFSGIARDFDMWVVAGSALLPENRLGIDTADFEAVSAHTYNVSYTFAPDGHCAGVTRKVNLVPTQEDVIHLSPGAVADLAPVDTPFGRLGTLICYDGFGEAHTGDEPCFTPGAAELDALGTDVIAQPSANSWPWDAPWAFNDPGETQLRREQWFTEGLFGHLGNLRHVRYAVNPQLVGTILDNHFEAPSIIMERRPGGEAVLVAESETPDGEDVVHAVVPAPLPAPA